MVVKDVMRNIFALIGPEATILEAAQLMGKSDAGVLPVVEQHKVVGVITHRDVVTRVLAGACSEEANVRTAMTSNPLTFPEATKVDKALRLMSARAVRHALVLNGSEQVVGILEVADAALACQDRGLAVEARDAFRFAAQSKSIRLALLHQRRICNQSDVLLRRRTSTA